MPVSLTILMSLAKSTDGVEIASGSDFVQVLRSSNCVPTCSEAVLADAQAKRPGQAWFIVSVYRYASPQGLD